MVFRFQNAYVREKTDQRREKDRFFQSSHHSPIPYSDRLHFHGLAYYPPDEAYRITARIEAIQPFETIALTTSDGQQQIFHRVAFLYFKVAQTEYHLTAYQSVHDHGESSLFVPFRDKGAGTETYGAGRYLDIPLNSHMHQLDVPRLPLSCILDFNDAYDTSPRIIYTSRQSYLTHLSHLLPG